ncbi:MAG: hypothetical protein ACUVQY_04350 [Thermoproteota archaeon]
MEGAPTPWIGLRSWSGRARGLVRLILMADVASRTVLCRLYAAHYNFLRNNRHLDRMQRTPMMLIPQAPKT